MLVKLTNPGIIAQKLKKLEAVAESPKTGIWLAETCAKNMDQYIPYQTGNLKDNFTIEPFKITYTAEYARYQFYGKFDHSKNKHPLATGHWSRAMMTAHEAQISSELKAFINSQL